MAPEMGRIDERHYTQAGLDCAVKEAESRGYARGIEAAAAHAASFPAHQCGHLPSDPFECAAQVAREMASGIRALLPAPSEGVE